MDLSKVNLFNNLINVIICGTADSTYHCYLAHKLTYDSKIIRSGYACVLDGDMKIKKSNQSTPMYPEDGGLFFLFSDTPPEKFLVKSFLLSHKNKKMSYHVEASDVHCLFHKMQELGLSVSDDDAFEKCWQCFVASSDGKKFIKELNAFLINRCKFFSPSL